MFKKLGFTLSEILIVIGIIGVVATITIPTIIKNIQKDVLKTQIRHSYSMYSQAFEKTKLDLNYNISNLQPFEWGEFNTTLISNLRVTKVCKGNALAGGCLPKYANYVCSGGCPAYSQSSIENSLTVYVLADGSTFLMYHPTWLPHYLIDINGQKGPNKSGYDLFQLEVNGGKVYIIADCITMATGGLKKYIDIDKW